MPGTETTTPAPQDPQLFFQDPTGCYLVALPSRTSTPFPQDFRLAYSVMPAVAGSN
jgi:hypothetical protein